MLLALTQARLGSRLFFVLAAALCVSQLLAVIAVRRAEPPLFAERPKVAGGPLAWRPAPEHLERLVKGRQILLAMNQQRPKREIEIRPPADVDMLQGTRHILHAARMHVEAERMKEPAEMKQVVKKKGHERVARFRSSEIRSPRTA